MSSFDGGARYDDNPFIFMESDEYVENPKAGQEMPNPLRAMYEDLAPLLLRSPPSKRYPQQPSGMKAWDILTDPISELVFTSAIPDPVIGGTLQRTMRPTVEGKEGLATHLNILVDCSGSMGDGTYYGTSPTGFPLAGYHLAQIVTAMMIAQAELAKDTFAVWGFDSGTYRIWEGPSGEHDRAIDYFLDLSPQESSPFKPNGTTHLYLGINKIGLDLADYTFDQSVTVILLDAAWDDKNEVRRQLFATHDSSRKKEMQYTDRQLREMGPVFYVVIGSPYTDDGTVSGVDGEEGEMDKTIRLMREVLTEEYKQNMSGCVLDFALVVDAEGGGNMMEFGGALVEMAQVNAGLNTSLKPCPKI